MRRDNAGSRTELATLMGLYNNTTGNDPNSAEYTIALSPGLMAVIMGRCGNIEKPWDIEVPDITIPGEEMLPYVNKLLDEGKSFKTSQGESDETLMIEWTIKYVGYHLVTIAQHIGAFHSPIVLKDGRRIVKEAIEWNSKSNIVTNDDKVSFAALGDFLRKMMEDGTPFTVSSPDESVQWKIEGLKPSQVVHELKTVGDLVNLITMSGPDPDEPGPLVAQGVLWDGRQVKATYFRGSEWDIEVTTYTIQGEDEERLYRLVLDLLSKNKSSITTSTGHGDMVCNLEWTIEGTQTPRNVRSHPAD